MLVRILIAILPIFLSGCMVGPNYCLPPNAVFNKPGAAVLVSAHRSAFSHSPEPDKWWELYHDRTLNKLIEEALSANTDLRIATANLARANAVLNEAKWSLYPSTNLFATFTNLHVSSETFLFHKPIPTLPFVNYLIAGGGVVLPLDFFGKLRRGIELASADKQAAIAARHWVMMTVIAETASAYTDMCAAGYQLNVAEELLRIQKQATILTKRLEIGGRAIAIDVTRAQSEFDQIKATIPGLKANSRNAMYRLAMLTGKVPTDFIHQIKTCRKLPSLRVRRLPVGNGAILLRRRPDIREAERKLAAATAKIGVETADLYPDVSFAGFGSTLGHPQDAHRLSTFFSSVGPLVTWKFPNISITLARIAEAQADTRAAFASFDGVVLNALKEVESNLTTYAQNLDRVKDLKAAHAQSKKAFLQTKSLYINGRQEFLSVLEAQKTLTAVSATLAVAESQIVTDQINLFLSLGGGWRI
jgi:outer membrane protein, multidrug efflux system